MDSRRDHDAAILDQFTRQANPFADHPAHAQKASLALILEALALAPTDDVLDVACGPGLLAAALAPHARSVTGLDFVPAMLERARHEQTRRGLTNLSFEHGDARALPYPEARFERVVSRFGFHHFQEPAEVLAEMARVCKPGGLVAVIDATPEPEQSIAYDEIERMRDPSHTHALPLPALCALFDASPLRRRAVMHHFALPMELRSQLAASFPAPGDAERIEARLRADAEAGVDRHGLAAHLRDGALWIAYPCSVVVALKPVRDA